MTAADRFRDARRRGRPAWLWPEVAPAEWRTAQQALEQTARGLLAGQRAAPLVAENAARERALCLAAYTSGLGPWLGWQVERGLLEADNAATRQLECHLAHGRARWTRLRGALDETFRVLSGAGIEATAFKGAHTAQHVFAEPGLRPMSDLDLLVSLADMERAEQALAHAGYVEKTTSRMHRPRRSEWQPPGAPTELRTLLYVHEADPYAIDLHATLDIDFFGVRTVAFGNPAASDTEPAPWLGQGATVLRQPLLAAQLAVHAAHGLHGLTLIRLVELALVLRRDMCRPSDWAALVDRLTGLDAARFAYPALALTEQLAPGTVEPRLLRVCAASAPARLRNVVARLTPATAQRIDHFALEERFMWASGPVEHLRRAARMLLPTGRTGPLRRLGTLYANRAFQLLRGTVNWRSQADR